MRGRFRAAVRGDRGSWACNRSVRLSSPKSSPGLPKGQRRTLVRAVAVSRKSSRQLSRGRCPSLERAIHGSRESSVRLRQEHGASPRRAGRALPRGADTSREGCRHLDEEHRGPNRTALGCSPEGTLQLSREHGRPARRAAGSSRERCRLLSRWRRPLPRSVASGSGLLAS